MKIVELVELLDEVVGLEVEQSDDNDSVDGRGSGSDMRRQHGTRCSWSAKTSESVAGSGRCWNRRESRTSVAMSAGHHCQVATREQWREH